MSNYSTKAQHPKTKKWEDAQMLDNHFGHHRYGVMFSDGQVFPEQDVKFENDVCTNCGRKLIDVAVLSPTTDRRYRHMCAECALETKNLKKKKQL